MDVFVIAHRVILQLEGSYLVQPKVDICLGYRDFLGAHVPPDCGLRLRATAQLVRLVDGVDTVLMLRVVVCEKRSTPRITLLAT